MAIRPFVPAVPAWEAIKFKKIIVGWSDLAAFVARHSSPPHLSSDALRLRYWSGRIPLRAVRCGQHIVFDRTTVEAFVRRSLSGQAA